LYFSIHDFGVMEGLGMLGSIGIQEVFVEVMSEGLME